MTKEELFSLKINKIKNDIYTEARHKWDLIQKPIDGLGDFEKVTSKILAINGTVAVDKLNKVLVIMCADHGVVEEGVSQTGKEVTLSVAKVLGQNKSTASRLAAYAGVDCIAVDVGIDSDVIIEGVRNHKIKKGTNNFAKAPSMTEDEALKAIETGISLAKECKENGYNMLATGEMGIGNTTSGTAMLCALTGVDVDEVLGRGAGLSDEGLVRKKNVIENALIKYGFQEKCLADSVNNTDTACGRYENCNRGNTSKEDDEKIRSYALNIITRVGGLELAAMTGLFIGGAIYEIPVMIDGALSAVSALFAETLVPGCKDYMIPSHFGREKATAFVLNRLSLRPLINGDMALGEGTGALMAMPLLDMAFDFYNNALTFEAGNVEQYERF